MGRSSRDRRLPRPVARRGGAGPLVDLDHGVFGVGTHLVGVGASHIHEMFVLGDVRRPPNLSRLQRGVVPLRRETLAALDLRLCLGLPSALTEVADLQRLLREREEDHHAWLAELERCTREGRPFTLARDPHLCGFGRWYYAYQCDNAVVRGVLAGMEKPHALIHGLADEVEAMKAAGRIDEAVGLVERARAGTLSELLRLFEAARKVVAEQCKEIGVVVEVSGRRAVLVVDRAEAVARVDPLEEGSDPFQAGALEVDLVARVGRWKGSPSPVMVLDLERLLAAAAGR